MLIVLTGLGASSLSFGRRDDRSCVAIVIVLQCIRMKTLSFVVTAALVSAKSALVNCRDHHSPAAQKLRTFQVKACRRPFGLTVSQTN